MLTLLVGLLNGSVGVMAYRLARPHYRRWRLTNELKRLRGLGASKKEVDGLRARYLEQVEVEFSALRDCQRRLVTADDSGAHFFR